MKKIFKRTLVIFLATVMVFGTSPLTRFVGLVLPNIFDFKAEATQSKSENFSPNYTLNGVPEDDMLAIALAQKDKTKSDLGYTEAWCANFVCDCAKLANQEKAIPFYGGCNGLRKQVIAAGGKEVSSRKKGDLIFYYCNNCSLYVHVGLVLDSTYTIEGNYSGKVTMVSGSYSHYDDYGNKHSTSSGTIVKTYVRPAYSSTGEHIHNYVAEGYEQLHPHKVFRRCECGEFIYTKEEKKLSTCLTCYPPVLKVYFNANGGSISSDTYKISSSVVCNKSDGSKFIQKWTYNEPKENGLTNHSTFGLYKQGYTFAGWGTKTIGGTVYDQGDNTLVPTDLNSKIKDGNCSVTLYAQWIPNTLKVYFNSNGGSISSDTYKISSNVVCNKSDGSKFTQNWTYNNKKENGLTNYSSFGLYKTGYTFAGWGTKSSGGTIYGQSDNTLVPTTLSSANKNGDSSLTLYAQWVPNTLNVYYNANGASITSETYKISSNLIYTKSDSAKFYQKWTYNNAKENGLYNPSTFGIYKPGYHFVGWSTKPSGGTIFDQNDATVTPLKLSGNIKDGSQSIILYAQWEPNTVRVYYNANGGALNSDAYKLVSNNVCHSDSGEKIYHDWTFNNPVKNGFTNASTVGLYRTGYTFAGWSTNASGGTVFDQNDASIVPTDFVSTIKDKNCSVTMYAQWIPNTVTMHFQSAGELFCQTHTVTNNGKLVTKSAIERVSATQLNYDGKTYGVSGNRTATLTYGVDSYRISISDAGLSLNEHIGGGYIAYRDCDGKWRAFINGTVGWYNAEEINKAISNDTFGGYYIYGQTGALQTTAPKGNIYFYAVWVCNHTHNYILTDSYISSSCTEKSYSTYTCSCGDSYQWETGGQGHVWIGGSYFPTCEESGASSSACYGCGTVNTVEIPPLGHEYTGTVVKEPTCTEEGEIEYKCIRCDKKYSEHISTVSHTYVKTVIDSTCTSNGYTQKKCEHCDDMITEDYIETKEHDFQSEYVKPTCTEVGYTTHTCKLCGDCYVDNEVSALGHDIVVNEAVAATCTQTGLTEGQHCSRCDDVTVEQETVPVKAHNYIVKNDSTNHWNECDCGSKIEIQNHSFDDSNICYCGYKQDVNATISIKNNNGSKTINYGETLKLTAIVTDKPADAKIYWYVDGVKQGEGEAFNVNFETGTKTVEVKLVDSNGNAIKNASGNEIKDTENVTVKGGFFQKIISFFKNLFGMNRIVVQSIFKDTF